MGPRRVARSGLGEAAEEGLSLSHDNVRYIAGADLLGVERALV